MLLSKDRKNLYFASSRVVFKLSLDTMEILKTAHIANVSRMIEIDSDTLFLINTTGQLFQWSTEGVQKMFQWQVPNWYEGSFYLLYERYLISESWTGIWRYDLEVGKYRKIFEITQDELTQICSVSENQICFLRYSKRREDRIHLYKIDGEGNILSHAFSPKVSTTWISQTSVYANGNWWVGIDEYNHDTNQRIYCFGEKGETIRVIDDFAGHDSVDFIAANEDYLACVCMYESGGKEAGVLLIHKETGRVVKEFDNEFLTKTVKDGINPPTMCLFLPGNRIAIGSWNRLWIVSYKDEGKDAQTADKSEPEQHSSSPEQPKVLKTSERKTEAKGLNTLSADERKKQFDVVLAAWRDEESADRCQMNEEQAWKWIAAFDADALTGGFELFVENHGILQLMAVRQAFQAVGLSTFSELIESYVELMGLSLRDPDSDHGCSVGDDDIEEEHYDFYEVYAELRDEEALEEQLLQFGEKHHLTEGFS